MDLIAVHVGAGSHNQRKEKAYFGLCSKACDIGIEAFECGEEVSEVVSKVVKVLEDSELTNAGKGSNLCRDGSVECDASIMSGDKMRWTGVGAMSGVKNPISVAHALHKSQDEKQICALVTPILLVGKGATDWASSHGFETDSILTCDGSIARFNKYKRKFEEVKNAVENESIKQRRFDTIGAIAISRDGQSAAGVSSGGVALKTPGRIGQAAIYGAGCWAEDGSAATTSGTGEQLIKTNFARVLNDCLVNPLENENIVMAADRAFIRYFINSNVLKEYDVDSRLAGFLAAVRDPSSSRIQLVCGHNTQTMIYSFRSSKARKASCFFSRFDDVDSNMKLDCHLI